MVAIPITACKPLFSHVNPIAEWYGDDEWVFGIWGQSKNSYRSESGRKRTKAIPGFHYALSKL